MYYKNKYLPYLLVMLVLFYKFIDNLVYKVFTFQNVL